METSAVQEMDLDTVVDKVETITEMVLVEATKEGGMHFTSSTRAIMASIGYIGRSRDSYKGNPILEGVIEKLSHWREERNVKFDYKTLDSAEVMRNVDAVVPALEVKGEMGVQTKRFLYELAETMVSASGSGFMGSGEKVNENEARFLADLKAHLRL